MGKIHICPIKAILHSLDDERTGYILCTSEGGSNTAPPENVLLLRFSDVVDSKRRDAFKLYQAVLVRDFFRMNPNYEDFFVCCDSGESRSPAIAAALMRAAGESDLEIWKNPEYHPNPHVYTVMCRALGIELDPNEVHYRASLSRLAFYNRGEQQTHRDADGEHDIRIVLYEHDDPYETNTVFVDIKEAGLDFYEIISEKAPGERYGLAHKLDRENKERLAACLSDGSHGLSELLTRAFSGKDATRKFKEFCIEHTIQYRSYLV